MKHISLYILLLVTFSLGACKKYVEIPPPQNQLVADLVFTDSKTATAAVAGLYSRMNGFNNSFANFYGTLLPSSSADDFRYGFANANFDEFRKNDLLASNSAINSLWEPVYSFIYHANSIIEGLADNNAVPDALKSQLVGEAKFLRAFYYFYLVNYFGDVPLVLDTDYKKNTSLPRTASAEVYASIIKDLVEAQASLSDSYPTAERTRVNKAAATALLARTYLYTEQWAQAEAEASKVIGDAKYDLLQDLNAVFLKNSREAIWQLQTVNTSTTGVNTWEGFSMVPFAVTSTPLYRLYPSLVTAFETEDKRKESWIKEFTNASGTVHYPYKYKVRTSTPVVEYSMVLRYAELYLIRAEARARQNNLEGALDDLDMLRERAGLAPLPDNISQVDLLLAVENERRLELFAEWGHRWLDLKRTGRAIEVLSPLKPDITANDLLYPLPLSAILTNPALEQNPGYN